MIYANVFILSLYVLSSIREMIVAVMYVCRYVLSQVALSYIVKMKLSPFSLDRHIDDGLDSPVRLTVVLFFLSSYIPTSFNNNNPIRSKVVNFSPRGQPYNTYEYLPILHVDRWCAFCRMVSPESFPC